MKRLILHTGLMNTLTAIFLSAAVYFSMVYGWTSVHPLGQFRFLLGVVTLVWLIVGMNKLRIKVYEGELKVTYALLFSLGVGLVSAISYGLAIRIACWIHPEFWQTYLADQIRNLEQAAGILKANYSEGTLENLRSQIHAQSPWSLILRISLFRLAWHLFSGLWVGMYFRK